jgi:hypothetical protein
MNDWNPVLWACLAVLQMAWLFIEDMSKKLAAPDSAPAPAPGSQLTGTGLGSD